MFVSPLIKLLTLGNWTSTGLGGENVYRCLWNSWCSYHWCPHRPHSWESSPHTAEWQSSHMSQVDTALRRNCPDPGNILWSTNTHTSTLARLASRINIAIKIVYSEKLKAVNITFKTRRTIQCLWAKTGLTGNIARVTFTIFPWMQKIYIQHTACFNHPHHKREP